MSLSPRVAKILEEVWAKLRLGPRLPRLYPSEKVVGTIVLVSIFVAYFQGLDYVLRPPDSSFTVSFIEASLSMDAWGWMFGIFASVAFIGIIFEIWPLAVVGHGLLACLYFAFSLGSWISLIIDWQGWGWQLAALYGGLAIFHAFVSDGCYDEWAKEWKRPPPDHPR